MKPKGLTQPWEYRKNKRRWYTKFLVTIEGVFAVIAFFLITIVCGFTLCLSIHKIVP